MRILSIDPGFERIGIAVIEREAKQKDILVYSACFKTSAKIPFHERLTAIGEEMERVIKKYKPGVLAIEKLYFTTNQKTVMGVSEARGVIVYSASRNGLQIFEYTPPQIKVAVTGYGKADKEQVMKMVRILVDVDPVRGREGSQRPSASNGTDDELDAIAIGLTCLACEKFK